MNAICSSPKHLYGSTFDIRAASFKPIWYQEKYKFKEGHQPLSWYRIEDKKNAILTDMHWPLDIKLKVLSLMDYQWIVLQVVTP